MSNRDQDQRNPQNPNEKAQPGRDKGQQQQSQMPGQKSGQQQQGGHRSEQQRDTRRDQR